VSTSNFQVLRTGASGELGLLFNDPILSHEDDNDHEVDEAANQGVLEMGRHFIWLQ
jgi:hypothetical protein